jgi:hypothetical protein
MKVKMIFWPLDFKPHIFYVYRHRKEGRKEGEKKIVFHL